MPYWRVALALLAVLAVGCGGGSVNAADVPPAGQVWFGTAFDPQTFAVSGRTSSVGTQTPVALVARLPRAAEAGLTIRASHDGVFVTSVPVTVTGEGEIVGLMLGALLVAGEWRYDLVDIGGNVLASGTVTAR